MAIAGIGDDREAMHIFPNIRGIKKPRAPFHRDQTTTHL